VIDKLHDFEYVFAAMVAKTPALIGWLVNKQDVGPGRGREHAEGHGDARR
jgi:hypothetical protein